MTSEANQSGRLQQWQRASAWPLVALSLVYTAVYITPIFAYPLHRPWSVLCHYLEYIIWAIFVVDYTIQFQLAVNKKTFLRDEWLALLFVVIPFFRPVRAVRGIVFLRQATTRPRNSLLVQIPWIIGSMGALMMLIMAAAVLNAERFARGANIHSVGDALWWSLVTVTTIGYGDKYPVTAEGRLLAAVLLIFGIGMIASLTGYFASWILRMSSSETTRDKGYQE